MQWKSLDIVAFDTETTGLDPFSGDRIIEVALVVLRIGADGRIADRRDVAYLIDPGIPIPRKITEITGISDGDVAGKPPFAVIAQELADTFKGAVAVAHNYPFDHGFLTTEFGRAGVPWHEPLAAVDTLDLSMKLNPKERSHKLGDVAKRLEVELETAHRATDDAAACGMVFLELARKHDVADELQALLDWASAIGRPPPTGPFGVDTYGVPVFLEGPHEGEHLSEHPVHLHWMEKAKVLGPQGWTFRYPESARRWLRRWLDVRCSGRAKQNPKSFRGSDWVLDPCIADERYAPGGSLAAGTRTR